MKKYITIVEFIAFNAKRTETFIDDHILMRHSRRKRLRKICSTFIEISYATYEAQEVRSQKFENPSGFMEDISERNREYTSRAEATIKNMGDKR